MPAPDGYVLGKNKGLSEGMMSPKKYLVGGIWFLTFCIGLFFGFGGAIFDRLDEFIARLVPNQLATLALISCLILIPVIEYVPQKPRYLRMSLWVLFGLSVLMLPAAKHVHPIISWYAAVLFFAELTLFMPWWKGRMNRVDKSSDAN